MTTLHSGYTDAHAQRFDPVLRAHAPDTARFLFENAKDARNASLLPALPGATFENVEFSTACRGSGQDHNSACEIRYVTVRLRNTKPGGHASVSGFPELIGASHMQKIRQAHNLAYPG